MVMKIEHNRAWIAVPDVGYLAVDSVAGFIVGWPEQSKTTVFLTSGHQVSVGMSVEAFKDLIVATNG